MREEDYLLISGIQHFLFCRRQWALIHLEQQWAENYFTADGEAIHENVHENHTEKRGDLLRISGMNVQSGALGIRGQCDLVEFHRDPKGITLTGRDGSWQPVPVEFKRGKPKEHRADELQLMAQAVCLEEMLCCNISYGYLFYGEPHRRTEVRFDDEIRVLLQETVEEMQQLFRRRYTPKVKTGAKCRACSLRDLCLPKLEKCGSAQDYLLHAMEEKV